MIFRASRRELSVTRIREAVTGWRMAILRPKVRQTSFIRLWRQEFGEETHRYASFGTLLLVWVTAR